MRLGSMEGTAQISLHMHSHNILTVPIGFLTRIGTATDIRRQQHRCEIEPRIQAEACGAMSWPLISIRRSSTEVASDGPLSIPSVHGRCKGSIHHTSNDANNVLNSFWPHVTLDTGLRHLDGHTSLWTER